MNATSRGRHIALAAAILVIAGGGAAFSDNTVAGVTVLRGMPAHMQQEQKPQQVAVMPPPLPSCPEGHFYSLLGGYCYQLIDPVAGRR